LRQQTTHFQLRTNQNPSLGNPAPRFLTYPNAKIPTAYHLPSEEFSRVIGTKVLYAFFTSLL